MASNFRSDFKKSDTSASKLSNDSFYPMRMTEDHKTEQYVKFAKVMVIFQGPVTEERCKAVSQLASKFKYSGRLLSDETYKNETFSNFSERKVDDFYSYFKSRVKKSCEELNNIIIIDQSMSNVIQMKYFCSLAQAGQYLIIPYPPTVDAVVGRLGNVRKNLAEKFMEFTKTNIERPNYFKHLFCGWFLHDVDSHDMRTEASLYVQDCLSIPDFRDFFSKVCGYSDFREHYNMLDNYQDLAYCTMKIFHNQLDTVGYMSTCDFKKYYGCMSKLYVVGFVISPHSIAARVKLSYGQKKLWEMPDDLVEEKAPNLFPSELLKSTKYVCDEKMMKHGIKSNRTIIAGEPIYEPTKAIHPNAVGRACHIVLCQVKDAPLKNLNYDVQFAVHRETIVVQKYAQEVRPYDLDRCLVRRIGKYWFIYLKETIIVNGLFSTCAAVESD